MAERDYIQRPVDEAYREGIERMPRGRPSAGEWFNQLAHILAMGLAFRGGVGAPWRFPAKADAPLQYKNLTRRMGEAGGSNPLPLGKTWDAPSPRPTSLEEIRSLTPNSFPSRPRLTPTPPPLHQPAEHQVGRPSTRGTDDTLFFDYIKELYRRGVR